MILFSIGRMILPDSKFKEFLKKKFRKQISADTNKKLFGTAASKTGSTAAKTAGNAGKFAKFGEIIDTLLNLEVLAVAGNPFVTAKQKAQRKSVFNAVNATNNRRQKKQVLRLKNV